jgi:opacity protein-like surface antigen
MMKSKTMRLLVAALLLGAAPALFAQGGGEGHKPYLSFGFNFAQGHGQDMTQKTWGGLGAFTGEVGIEFFNPYSGIVLRPNVGYAKILGEALDTMPTYNLLGWFVGMDLIYNPVKALPLSVTVGPSIHTWSIERINFEGNPVQGDKDWKFGWRFGVGYEVMDNLRVDLVFTQTEWRSISTMPYVPGYNPGLPAYFTLKASYSF